MQTGEVVLWAEVPDHLRLQPQMVPIDEYDWAHKHLERLLNPTRQCPAAVASIFYGGLFQPCAVPRGKLTPSGLCARHRGVPLGPSVEITARLFARELRAARRYWSSHDPASSEMLEPRLARTLEQIVAQLDPGVGLKNQ